MYVHEEKKIAFIAHPRTASSATSHVLKQMGFEIIHSHHGLMDMEYLNGWDVFCTVRNPFDVIVSWFYNQPREKPFSLWLPEFLDGCQYLQGIRMFFGQPYCDHILHYENLQDEFEDLMDEFGFPIVEIPQRNVSETRDSFSFMGHYNPRTFKLVIDSFRQDFLNNGYPTRLS